MTNSLTKPSRIFNERIAPAYNEYLSDPKNKRLARILAAALDHHLEWTFQYYKQNDPSRLAGANNLIDFQEATFGKFPTTRMMWDLADADKHILFTMERLVPRLVHTSTNPFSVYKDELWVDPYNKPFLPEVTAAMEYWKNWPD
jgi:hypothetical protein